MSFVQRHFAAVALALGLPLALAPVVAHAEDPPVNRADQTNGPDGRPLTADDIKELAAMQEAIGRFEAAQKDYRGTVSHIVKIEYEKKRRELVAKYDAQIQAAEKEEKFRRDDAIILFEKFLAKYPTDKRWTPDVIFRLAELYFERTSDQYLAATQNIAPGAPTPNIDFTQTIDLYKRLITDFPDYRLIDGAYYLMGYCLDKMGQELPAKQSFLALVCSNQYKALDPPAPVQPSQGHGAAASFQDPYQQCKPIKDDSRFNPEAWTRIGEYHFDYNELELAIAAYARVLKYPDSPYYDKALYKLAWSYYRADKYPEAIKNFDTLVVFSDKQKAASGKEGSDLRAESVQYLGVSFAEKDWNGDGIDDAETGLQRLESFYKGREKEPHVKEIFQKLGDIYFDETEYGKSIEVYKRMLALWPLDPDAPKIQDRIVLALERQRLFDEALKAREQLAKNYSKGTDWYKHNQDNKEAIDDAQERAEQALVKYAVEHHKAAQQLKKEALASHPPDGRKLELAAKEYSLAADGYKRYLETYPNSKNTYEYTFFYAEALFYSAHFEEAATEYEKVRDSNLDNKYLEDSAFNAVKAYENQIDLDLKSGKLIYPPLPGSDQAQGKIVPPVQPMEIPPTVKKLQAAYDAFAQKVPASGRISVMAYKTAEIDFRYLHWEDARARFQKILDKYCKEAVATQAARAILTTYVIENDPQKIVDWTTKITQQQCGTGDDAKALAKQAGDLKHDATFKLCDKMFEAKDYENASTCYLKIVDSDPQNNSKINDLALNNAAVGYENVKRFFAATKLYERITTEYPDSKFVDDALFRTAFNYQRFFEFDKAVVAYQRLATDKRFANSAHRTDSLYNAAVLLEGDQAYDQAAKLFQQYAAMPGVKKEDAQEAYFHSAMIYFKSKDYAKASKTFKDFIRLYPGDPKKIIEAQFHIGECQENTRDKAGALATYKRVAEMGSQVQAASDPAEFAAHAEFIRVEQELPKLEAQKLSSDPKKLLKSIQDFKKEIDRLGSEYDRVLSYKRATWSLAAYFRKGYLQELLSKSLAALLQAPCPAEIMRKFKQEGCDVYQQQMTEQIEKLTSSVDEEVMNRYQAVLDNAAKLGVANDWTKLARQHANAYDPNRFPMLKDEHVDFQMEAPQ